MKVKDLLEEINRCQKEYGDDFLAWDVFTEQITGEDKQYKKKKDWKWFKDSEGWEYFKCSEFWTRYPKRGIFTINVNY